MMELRSYKVKLEKNIKGQLELEIYTKHETMTAEQYCTIMKEVIHYLGKEGFFNNQLPSNFAIYNNVGQLLRIEDMV